jgi:2-oxoglutarate dehydrogenase E2 component (dihydrolipoamide succinyltransferase)
MSIDVKIPQLAESISEAVLVEWLKQDGEAVRMDEPIATLETDKAAVELAAEENGVLKHGRPIGETVHVGDVIATIDPSATPTAEKQEDAPVQSAAPAVASPPAPTNGDVTTPVEPLPLSPAVRRLVEEHALDPAAIRGTGKGGRILKEDVLRHLEAPTAQASAPAAPATPAATPESPPVTATGAARTLTAMSGEIVWEEGEAERTVPMGRIRRRIAERLVQAQQTAAILTTFNEVDMSEVIALRKRYKEDFEKRHGVKLGFMSFFTRACVLALEEIPEVNAEVRDETIVYKRNVHMGIAVGTPRGLVVPVIRNADARGFAELESELNRLAIEARDGTLSLDDLMGGTFTISNGGVYGSLLSTPILNPPQSGILGIHKIEKRPIALPDDTVAVRPMMYVALSYDHRIVDGEQAVTFLVRVKERLEDPERMMLDV